MSSNEADRDELLALKRLRSKNCQRQRRFRERQRGKKLASEVTCQLPIGTTIPQEDVSLYRLRGNDLIRAAALTSLSLNQYRPQSIPRTHCWEQAMNCNAMTLKVDWTKVTGCDMLPSIPEFDCFEHYKMKSKNVNKLSKAAYWQSVPQCLHPTTLQLTLPHNPALDCGFVWPSMRDKLLALMAANLLDKLALTKDLLGGIDDSSSFMLYGDDPSDPKAWEIGEAFVRKWTFLCDESMLHETNKRRRERGEQVLHLPSILDQYGCSPNIFLAPNIASKPWFQV